MDKNVSDKTMVTIDLGKELARYNLTGTWNDYIGVQKEILRVLRKDKYFESSIITNRETGMQIVISPKDVRETFGKGNRFQSLPRELKEYKVATISRMKELIGGASLLKDNVANIHPEKTDEFAYSPY